MQERPHDADCSTGPAESFCGNVAFFQPTDSPLFAELNPVFSAAELPNRSFSGVVHA